MQRESAVGSLVVRGGAATHRGNVRTLNEDAFLLGRSVYAVADGMGGHQAGEVASAITIETCAAMDATDALPITSVAEMVERANASVRRHAVEHRTEGMGCTLVGVALVDNAGVEAVLAFNVGDSRAYLLAGGEPLTQLTVDHSLVQEMVDRGEIAADAARTHAQRNVVTRAIGIEEQVAADYFVVPTVRELRLLLCSDGVSTELADGRLAELLDACGDPADAAQAIVDAVLQGRAADNATAVVIDVVRPVAVDDDDLDVFDETGPPPRLLETVPLPAAPVPDTPRPDVDELPPDLIDEVPL